MASQDSNPVAPGPDPKSSSDYIQFKCTPPGGDLNRWSTVLTRGHDYPGAQVRLQLQLSSAALAIMRH